MAKKTAKAKTVYIYASLDGDPFHINQIEGEAPVDTICRYLTQWLKANVTLWPVDATTYRAQWYDAKREMYKECPVEIKPIK